MPYHFNFETSHHQFYIVDKVHEEPDAADFWTETAYDHRLAYGKGILGVSTASYGIAKGEIIFLVQRNDNYDLQSYDHIIEHSLEVNSGILEIQDCLTSTVEFEKKVTPGTYRVRIYYANLDSPMDEVDNCDDSYKIEIWPEAFSPEKIIKKHDRGSLY